MCKGLLRPLQLFTRLHKVFSHTCLAVSFLSILKSVAMKKNKPVDGLFCPLEIPLHLISYSISPVRTQYLSLVCGASFSTVRNAKLTCHVPVIFSLRELKTPRGL